MKWRDKTKCLCQHFQKWPLILGALLESLHKVLASSKNEAPRKVSQACRMRDCLKILPWSCVSQHLSWVGVGCTSDCDSRTAKGTASRKSCCSHPPSPVAMAWISPGKFSWQLLCRTSTKPFPLHTSRAEPPSASDFARLRAVCWTVKRKAIPSISAGKRGCCPLGKCTSHLRDKTAKYQNFSKCS